MDPETTAALNYWKTHRYVENHIPFVEAVHSLSTKEPLIHLTQNTARKSEWTLCYIGTSTPAVMTYAAIFAESEPYDTGNLVWGNNNPVPSIEDSRITRFAGFKATYSYAIETYDDQEMWMLQQTLDEHVATVPGFNPTGLPRLEWQNGQMLLPRFFMRTPMFIPYQSRGVHPQPPAHLHPWVQAAHNKSRSYRANPRRPRVQAIVEGQLRPIADCATNKLEYGDVVGLVFTVVYVINDKTWGPVYHLTDVIRVMPANRATFPLHPPEEAEDEPIDDADFSITDIPTALSPRLQNEGGPSTVNTADNPNPPQTATSMDAPADPTVHDVSTTLSLAPSAVQAGPPGRDNGLPTSEEPPPYATIGTISMDQDDDDAGSSATETTRRSPSISENAQPSPDATSSEPHELQDAPQPTWRRLVRPRLEEYLEDDRVGPSTSTHPPSGKGRRYVRTKGKP